MYMFLPIVEVLKLFSISSSINTAEMNIYCYL